MGRNWLREKHRAIVARGFETARESSNEVKGLLMRAGDRAGARKPKRISKAELRAQAEAAFNSGVPIRRIEK
jgi:hypothetical protein